MFKSPIIKTKQQNPLAFLFLWCSVIFYRLELHFKYLTEYQISFLKDQILGSIELIMVRPLHCPSCLISDVYPKWVFLGEKVTSLLTSTMGIITYSLGLTSNVIFPLTYSISNCLLLSLVQYIACFKYIFNLIGKDVSMKIKYIFMCPLIGKRK